MLDHKVIEHFYYNNVHLNDIFHFFSATNSSLRKQMSCTKIKGAIIIHVKFSGARKLKILRCFRTLHVQILSSLKTGDHHTKKIKNITKMEQKRLLLLTFLVSFFMAFLAQKLIYTTNI